MGGFPPFNVLKFHSMKAKSDTLETYPLSKKEFTQFAKALVAVPKKELDKELAKDQHAKPKKKTA